MCWMSSGADTSVSSRFISLWFCVIAAQGPDDLWDSVDIHSPFISRSIKGRSLCYTYDDVTWYKYNVAPYDAWMHSCSRALTKRNSRFPYCLAVCDRWVQPLTSLTPSQPGIDSLLMWVNLHLPSREHRPSTLVTRWVLRLHHSLHKLLPFHHHRPSTPVTRWVFTFSTQAVDFYTGFAALCRAEFWLVADLLQHVFRPSPTFSPHRHCRHQNAGFWLAAIYRPGYHISPTILL